MLLHEVVRIENPTPYCEHQWPLSMCEINSWSLTFRVNAPQRLIYDCQECDDRWFSTVAESFTEILTVTGLN